MRTTFVYLGACLLLASAALPADAQVKLGNGAGLVGSGHASAPAASAPASSGGGMVSGGGSVGTASAPATTSSGTVSNRSGGNWSANSSRSGNWAANDRVNWRRNGSWNHRRYSHRRGAFAFGTWVGPSYYDEDCGWVRVKRVFRHRVIWHRVYRCY